MMLHAASIWRNRAKLDANGPTDMVRFNNAAAAAAAAAEPTKLPATMNSIS